MDRDKSQTRPAHPDQLIYPVKDHEIANLREKRSETQLMERTAQK